MEPLLAAKRKQEKLTQRELGVRIDVDQTALSRLENELRRGDTPTCPGHLEAACEALDVDPEEAGNMVELEVTINEC